MHISFPKATRWATAAVAALQLAACGAASVPAMRPIESPRAYAAPSDRARVVFFRTSGYGATTNFPVFADEGRFVGMARGGMQFSVDLPPGEHAFYTWAENEDAIRLAVEGGRTYFVVLKAQMGWSNPRVVMEVVDREHELFSQLGALLPRLPAYEPDAARGEAWVRENPDVVEAKLRAARGALAALEGSRLATHTGDTGDGLLPDEVAEALPSNPAVVVTR